MNAILNSVGLAIFIGAALGAAVIFGDPDRYDDARAHTFEFVRGEACDLRENSFRECSVIYLADADDLDRNLHEEDLNILPRGTRRIVELAPGVRSLAFSDDGRTIFFLHGRNAGTAEDIDLRLDLWSIRRDGSRETLIQTDFVGWDVFLPPLGALLGQDVRYDSHFPERPFYLAASSADERYTLLHVSGIDSSFICVTDGGLDEIDLDNARCFGDGSVGGMAWLAH